MEGVVFFDSREHRQAGVWYPSTTGAGVVFCHGFTADKDRPRFVTLAEQLSARGFGVLRFDFLGSGESDREPISVENQVDALRHAMAFMRERGCSVLGIVGESLGGLVALRACDESVKTMVLWAPVTGRREPGWEQKRSGFSIRANDIVFQKDHRVFLISTAYFGERACVDPALLLSRVFCPVLILHGDRDDVVPLAWSSHAISLLSSQSRLEILDGADHRLGERTPGLLSKTIDWFSTHLKS